MSVPVHANGMKPYFDPSDRPVCAPSLIETSPDLAASDFPPESFDSPATSTTVMLTLRLSQRRMMVLICLSHGLKTLSPAEIIPVP